MTFQRPQVLLPLFSCVVVLFCPWQTSAENSKSPKDLQPKLCTGITPNGWGPVRSTDCPAHHAFYSQCCRPGGISAYAGGEKTPLAGVCCPLPGTDILLSDEPAVIAKERCPENYIVTGGRSPECLDCGHTLICSKINTERYQLAEARAGIAWGTNSSHWKIPTLITRAEIPLAIRYGVGREGRYQFAIYGCISRKPGSLFVGKHSKHCRDYFFRELQFAGSKGDPPRGTSVPMYPECQMLSDPFEKDVRCVH